VIGTSTRLATPLITPGHRCRAGALAVAHAGHEIVERRPIRIIQRWSRQSAAADGDGASDMVRGCGLDMQISRIRLSEKTSRLPVETPL